MLSLKHKQFASHQRVSSTAICVTTIQAYFLYTVNHKKRGSLFLTMISFIHHTMAAL